MQSTRKNSSHSLALIVATLGTLMLSAGCKTSSKSSKVADAGSDVSSAGAGAVPSTPNDVDQGAAANAALGQLSRYFAAWEVPNAAANFPVSEVISQVYNFKSPFGETYNGRDAMLHSITAFSAQVPPVAITMTTQTFTPVKNADGTISSTATVLGESQPQAGAVTGVDLAYQVNFDAINGAPPLINTMLESAVSAPKTEPVLSGHVPNSGRTTLYYWFFYFEENIADPTPLTRLISTANFSIQLDDGGTTVTTTADLAKWYQSYAAKYKQAYNKVSNFVINETSSGIYDMTFDTVWTGVRKDGGLDQGSRHEAWKLVDNGGQFALIESRAVSVTNPVHSL